MKKPTVILPSEGILTLFLVLSVHLFLPAQGLDHTRIKLFRFGASGNEKPAVEYADGKKLDVSAFGEDYNESFFAKDGIERLQKWLENNAGKCPAVDPSARIGSCVARPSKIVGIGLNYAAHAKEANQPVPAEPILFLKSTTSLSLLPGDVIATGTPSGVGLGQRPVQRFLKEGDTVEFGIENLGVQKQTAISYIHSELGDAAYKDYQNWVALGLGGIPHTLEGYRTVKQLATQMKDPLDVGRIASEIGSKGDVAALKKLPKRAGPKPVIAPFAVPHRQLDQHNDDQTRH